MMECLVMVLKVKLNQCLNATLHAQPKRFDEVSRYFGLATRLLLLVMLLVSSAGLRAQSPLNPGLPYGMSGTVLPGGLLPGGGLMPGVGLLPGSVSVTQQTPGSPRSSLALQCPPGTQGISCWEQNTPIGLLRSVQSGSQFLQQSQQAIAQGIQQRHVTDEPTQFQRHLERLTGRWLPIYGMNFFTDALVMRSDGLRAVGPEFANPGDYELGVGDEVQLNLWGQVEASLSLLIDTQGHITLPKIGPVQVAGLRVSQLESHLRSQFAKTFSNFGLSARAGNLRSIQVYVAGHARQPGAYLISGRATVIGAIQMAGGPSPTGTMRSVQLMRAGKAVASVDLYRLIVHGDTGKDLRLMPGDSLVIPPAGPRVALSGQVDQAGIYELLPGDDSVASVLRMAGVSLALSDARLSLDRVTEGQLSTASLRLSSEDIAQKLRDGDLLQLHRITQAFTNAVTLRGHVARPIRHAWRPGMRLSDLLPDVSALVTPDFYERRNALVQYEGPIALGSSVTLSNPSTNAQASQQGASLASFPGQAQGPNNAPNTLYGLSGLADPRHTGGNADPRVLLDNPNSASTSEIRRPAIPGTPYGIDPTRRLPGQRPMSEVRPLLDELHWDYAVIERLDPKTLRLELIPFHLGRLVLSGDASQNHDLLAGDVVTIFGKSDIRVPVQRQQRLIRIEGEVLSPGYYLADANDHIGSIIEKAGGLTPSAYLYGLHFTRESVKREQRANLTRLIKNLQDSQSNALAQAMTALRNPDGTTSASAGEALAQIRQQQQRVIDRLVKLEPEGRIALGLDPANMTLNALPRIGLEAGDILHIPSQPVFVNVQGATLSENALIWRPGQTAAQIIRSSGTPVYADVDNTFLLRADGTSLSLVNKAADKTYLMPGDTLVIPELADRRTNFWKGMDLARTWTSLFSQIGISLVAIKTLFNN